jgi:pimeloyl-ACP methyl ester carboxylesterase
VVTTGYLERDVMVRDIKLHYQEWGDPANPVILMLHGFGVSGHMFDEFAGRMEQDYHLIALDQRGHGDSDWSSEGDYSRDAFVADLESFQQILGLDRFVLMGHSMGGLNAVSYTVRNPSRVSALILVDVGPEAAKEGVDNIMRFTRGPDELEFEEFVEMAHRFNPRRTMENIRERMRHRLRQLPTGKWTWKFDKRFREQDSKLRVGSELSNDEMWQLYRAVQVPALLVRGAESDVLTPEVAERVAREMPRARLVVVSGAGHSVPGDNPDEFTSAVRQFVADVNDGRFEPVSATEPPALEELVETHAAGGRRTVGFLALAIAATTLLAGFTAFVFTRRAKARRRKALPARAARIARTLPAGALHRRDVEQARERALDLSRELAVAGRKGVSQARSAVQEVDLERARKAALEVLQALEQASHSAPAVLKDAAGRVDRKKLAKQGRRLARQRPRRGLLALLLFRRRHSSRRRLPRAWRR